MSDSRCLQDSELAELLDGVLPEKGLEPIQSHIAACKACRARLAQTSHVLQARQDGESLSSDPEGEARLLKNLRHANAPRPLRRKVPAWMFSAAASVLVAAGIGFYAASRPPSAALSDPRLASARPVSGRDETIEVHDAQGETVRLPGGTLLFFLEGARARFHPPETGERTHLELLRGRLEADVAGGEGLFRIRSAAGEIRVLGTRFRTNAYRIHGGSDAAQDCLAVGMVEGKILLVNAGGAVPVSAPGRGIVLAGRPPVRMEAVGTRRDVLLQFLPLLQRFEGGMSVRPGLERDADFLAALYGSGEWPGEANIGSREEQAALDILERRIAR